MNLWYKFATKDYFIEKRSKLDDVLFLLFS